MNDARPVPGERKTVFLLASIHGDAVDLLKADPRLDVVTWDDARIENWRDEADAVILRGLDLRGDDIRAARRLKVIGRHGAGVDSVDIEAARERGIVVLNTPFENSQSVAELSVTLMLAAARRVVQAHHLVRTGGWAEGRKGRGCRELYRNRVGFVGYGRIARLTADILRNAFEMEVAAYDPKLPDSVWQDQTGVTRVESLTDLFASCDFVSVNLPRTPETTGLISQQVLAAARPGLILVNTSRGGIVDEPALAAALADGPIGAAGMDVFQQEPPSPDHPLLSLPNFIATPHYGGATQESLRRVACSIARETAQALFGQATEYYRVA
ncbi:hydroxyacid dehydrogenase [Frigidibacter oleivorans]|uniref:hydroxyacid dehydrogenase n=1 Tax=Frigidibacter oleivorans TaxID=2487129 RepID=UPI000F8F551A|nr:hydroxyacid dehydrogenase [Frigidibacter oleivorans]